MIACPNCEEKGCDRCNGTGRFAVDACPKAMVGGEIIDTIRFAGLLKQGLPPVSGGVLDQAAWFVDAAQTVWSEDNRVEAEAYK